MTLSEYDNMADFQSHLEDKGLTYFFLHYQSASNVRIAGQPLPEGVIHAAQQLEEAVQWLQAWIGVQG